MAALNPMQLTVAVLSLMAVTFSESPYIPLKSMCTKITDGTHQKVVRASDGEVPFLYVSCISPGSVAWEKTDRISLKTYSEISKGREINKDVVLYTAVGSYGNAVHLGIKTTAAYQRHIAYIRVDSEKTNPKFIEIWLNSRFGKFHSDRLAIGNAQKTVTLGDLAKFPIPPIPIDVQDRIVSTYNYFECIENETTHRASKFLSIRNSLVHRN